MASIDSQIADLREIVRKLDNTGDDGFEGLMAAVLTDITKISFNLAKSGSQHGKDGQSASDSGSIRFECKLYDDKVAKNEVVSKIAEIAADDKGSTDLWIVASTGSIRTQDRETIEALGERVGIATLMVDWQTPGLPSLAALLAMAPTTTASFLALRTGVAEANMIAKLEEASRHIQFPDRIQELNTAIGQPSIAPAYAQKHNETFLRAAFESVRVARTVFGQPLAPGDAGIPGVLDRLALRHSLAKYVFAKPNGASTAILGSDGNGKSWLYAQAWLDQNPKPLTIVLVPDDIKTPFTLSSLEDLLISTLIVQTNDSETEISRRRWHRYFERWKRNKSPERLRLVVFMDGLNQRETVDWVKAVNGLNKLMTDWGGKLVFSCRTPFYRATLRNRLLDPVQSVEVPEWTNPELEQLLAARGTAIANLQNQVVEFLRNPRMFGVAAELFDKGQIEGFTELSISRLLFEHIRMGASPAAEPMSVGEFVKGVRHHADEIIKRLSNKKNIDLKVFERPSATGESTKSINDQLAVISAGRFFQDVDGDATLYSLKNDSTPLALGLSLLSTAHQAQRNRLNIADALSKILDPIAALDNTAEVLISALIAAVLSDDSPDDIIAALATAFVGLQNLDTSRYGEFRALGRRAPTAFLKALESAALAESVTANLSWLTEALFESRREAACWPSIVEACKHWLSMYSPAPERMIFGHHPAGSEERAKEFQTRNEVIDAKQAAFSDAEKALLGSLVLEQRGDYTNLNKIAFRFLGGGPLAEFGEAFRNWCFAASFNGGYDSAHDDFDHMIQFNRVDWAQTRAAMLKSAQVLREPGLSETGRWALVYVLRATASSGDAKEAKEIFEDLTKDRERRPGWRLIEDWCATDPCDPESQEPKNITGTAEKYAAIDVAQLRKHLGQGSEDHFFDDARAGLARFKPDAAIGTMRRFATDVLARNDADFRIAVFLLGNHTAAMDSATAARFVERAEQIANEALGGKDKNQELFIASQYGLSISFPHMSGDDQLAALLAYPKVKSILLSVCYLMRSCSPAKYEAALEKAYADGDTVNLFRLMAFGQHTNTHISDRAKTIVGALTSSTDTLVRLSAFGLVRRFDNLALLRIVAESDWNANKLDSASTRFETFYGSEVLVQAAARGIITVTECLERIALVSYSSLVRRVGREAALPVAARIDTALRKAVAHDVTSTLPDIEQRLDAEHRPDLFNIEDKPNPNEGVHEQFQRLAETGDAWYERQQRNREVVEEFERNLTRAGAQLIVETVTSDLVTEIFTHDPASVRKWHQSFMGMDEKAITGVHNLALVVAQVIAREDQKGAVMLFEKLASTAPYVRITFGLARMSLDAVTVWNAGDGDELRKLRFKRLDWACNDHDLAIEVLSAIRAGKEDDLRAYVLDRRARAEPAHIARAVMVAGFSEDTPWALETIDAHKDDYGFLSGAYNAAKYAMDRLRWSKYWAKQMRNATSQADLWRYAILLTKIVDGRFQVSEIMDGHKSDLIRQFGPTFNDLIRHRIDTWKGKREKKLFGMNAPDTIFLL